MKKFLLLVLIVFFFFTTQVAAEASLELKYVQNGTEQLQAPISQVISVDSTSSLILVGKAEKNNKVEIWLNDFKLTSTLVGDNGVWQVDLDLDAVQAGTYAVIAKEYSQDDLDESIAELSLFSISFTSQYTQEDAITDGAIATSNSSTPFIVIILCIAGLALVVGVLLSKDIAGKKPKKKNR